MPSYRSIMMAAWAIAFRARSLWWFAFFGGLLIGSGFGSAVLQTLNANPAQDVLMRVLTMEATTSDRVGALWAQARATGPAATVALSAYGVLLASLLALIVWLAVVGVNAIVIAASHASEPLPTLRELRRRAHARFWPTFGIHVIAKAAEAVLLTAWGAALIASAVRDTPMTNVRAILAFVVTVILITIIHVATPYAVASAVLDRRSMLTALREAFALLRDHWFIAVETSLFLTLANVAAIAVWIIGSALLVLPFLFLGSIAIAKGVGALYAIALIGGIGVLAVWLAGIAVIFTTFLISAWTLLFLRLTGEGEEPEAWITRKFKGTSKK